MTSNTARPSLSSAGGDSADAADGSPPNQAYAMRNLPLATAVPNPQHIVQLVDPPSPHGPPQPGPSASHSRDRSPLLNGVGRQPTSSNTAHAAPGPRRKDWLSWTLSWWFNVFLLIVEISFIATIVVLDRLSANNNGVCGVPQRVHNDQQGSGTLGSYVGSYVKKYYSLLWTSFPSFILQVFSLGWATVVSSSADRQPYIELERGSSALRTIMLEYNTIPEWKSWSVALFRNKHRHVGFGLLSALLVSLAIVPLSAHLLVQQSAQSHHDVQVAFTTDFNVNAINAKTNLQPFIDVATAVQAYNSSPPAWMTDRYAFHRFKVPDDTSSGNVTVDTTGYFADLQCHTIDPTAYQVQLTGSDLEVNFTDSGCSVEQLLYVSSNTPTYAVAWYSFCEGTRYNRFGMFAGQYSAVAENHLADFSVTSCIPTYWQTNGSLTMGIGTGPRPTYVSFDGEPAVEMFPGLEIVFENALRDYVVFNPGAGTNANAVGFSIYSTAVQRYSQTSPNSSSILNSTESVYATIYAALANSLLLQQAVTPRNRSATLTRTVSRLFISRTVAYIIIAALAIVFICHLILFFYARRHHTMLDEEPVGLLGAAKLLRRSDLFELIDKFEERHPEIGEMQKYMKKHYRLGHGEHCLWDKDERSVTVNGFEERP